MLFREIADFNPKTVLERGKPAPFIDMAALPLDSRDIAEIGRREFKSSGSKFIDGDTLIARITPCLENGKGAKVSGLGPGIAGHGSTEFVVVRAKDQSDENFVYYLSRYQGFRAYAEQHMIGTSGRQRVSWQSLAQFELDELESEDRFSIGSLLAYLDEKIENNRRMNEVLEAMAQAIFKDWFVDFGPTRRKLTAKEQDVAADPVAIMGGLILDPEKATQTAALFPDNFDGNGLPAGWKEEPLIDQADWINGAAYKNMYFVERSSGLPVIKIAELKNGVTNLTKFTNTDLGRKYRIDDGELLFSWSGNPETSIDTFLWSGGPGWLNQHIFAVRPNGKHTKPLLYTLLKYLKPEFTRIATDKQTTGLGHVTRGDMGRLMVNVASKEIYSVFNMIVEPIFERLNSAVFENISLAKTRDYLLPRLMSGQIRAANLEAGGNA